MLYTEDFSMRHYVGFSQIGSQISSIKCLQRSPGTVYMSESDPSYSTYNQGEYMCAIYRLDHIMHGF